MIEPITLPLPWAKFGVAIPKGERNIVKKAGLAWTITRNPVQARVLDKIVPIPHTFALIREPGCQFLDTCGKHYEPMQNVDLIRFWRTFASCSKLELDYVGAVQEDSWIWALSKTKYGFSLGSGHQDYLEAYLMMAHPHFYGETMRPSILLLRPVNMTMFTMRIPLGGKKFYMVNDSEWGERAVKMARDVVEQAKKMIHEVEIKAAKIATLRIDEETARRYFLSMLYTPAQVAQFKAIPDKVLRMMDFFTRGHGSMLPTCVNTWWGAFQAVCYFMDQAGCNEDYRFFAATLGPRSEYKRRALDVAYKHAIQNET